MTVWLLVGGPGDGLLVQGEEGAREVRIPVREERGGDLQAHPAASPLARIGVEIVSYRVTARLSSSLVVAGPDGNSVEEVAATLVQEYRSAAYQRRSSGDA